MWFCVEKRDIFFFLSEYDTGRSTQKINERGAAPSCSISARNAIKFEHRLRDSTTNQFRIQPQHHQRCCSHKMSFIYSVSLFLRLTNRFRESLIIPYDIQFWFSEFDTHYFSQSTPRLQGVCLLAQPVLLVSLARVHTSRLHCVGRMPRMCTVSSFCITSRRSPPSCIIAFPAASYFSSILHSASSS